MMQSEKWDTNLVGVKRRRWRIRSEMSGTVLFCFFVVCFIKTIKVIKKKGKKLSMR